MFAFHALAIDEHREKFAPTLWTKTVKKGPGRAAMVRPRARECWRRLRKRSPCANPPSVDDGKGKLHGLFFREEVAIDGDVHAPISDSFAEFIYGAYRIAKRGRRYYREIGAPPVETQVSEQHAGLLPDGENSRLGIENERRRVCRTVRTSGNMRSRC